MKLPLDCSADYIPDFLDPEEATELCRILTDDFSIDRARLVIEAGGRLIETDSYKILFATPELIGRDTYPETIHGKCYPWSGAMAALREKVETFTGKRFEVAMCLFYPDGNYFAPYHSDQMTSGDQTVLPSISLGGVRAFCFRKNGSEEAYTLELAHGSLLLMGEYCQSRYEHSLPKDPRYKNGRINITFREPSFK